MTRSGWSWLPSGGTLQAEGFRRRQQTLTVVLALHLPGLALLGYLRGAAAASILAAVAPVLVLVGLSRLGSQLRRALTVTAGLFACSVAVVLLSSGSPQSHYHLLVMIGFVALFQDWPPFLGLVALSVIGYLVGAGVAPQHVLDTGSTSGAFGLAAVHVAFVLAEAVAMGAFWLATEREQARVTELATSLTHAELQETLEQDEQRRTESTLLANLARRNQILLDRQLQGIDALEQREVDPEALAELFSLDHLATRMRRNAESLLVLADETPTSRWELAVPLSEICRGAMAEIEDYARADIALMSDVLVAGAAVNDLLHLVAELLENATSFSPPATRVLVSGNVTVQGYVLAISDAGIGMAEEDLLAANATLADPSAPVPAGAEVGMLGLRVVSRLAGRYGIRVWLQRGQAGGLAAMVALPQSVLEAAAPAAPVVPVVPAVPALPVVPAQPVPSQPAPAASTAAGSTPPSFPTPAAQQGHVTATPPPQVEPPAPAAAGLQGNLAAAPPLTAAGLQRRIPRASLAAPLAAQHAPGADAAAPAIEPERARSVLAAYTGGVRRAREGEPRSEDQSPDPSLEEPTP